jgi:hypothetical protein
VGVYVKTFKASERLSQIVNVPPNITSPANVKAHIDVDRIRVRNLSGRTAVLDVNLATSNKAKINVNLKISPIVNNFNTFIQNRKNLPTTSGYQLDRTTIQSATIKHITQGRTARDSQNRLIVGERTDVPDDISYRKNLMFGDVDVSDIPGADFYEELGSAFGNLARDASSSLLANTLRWASKPVYYGIVALDNLEIPLMFYDALLKENSPDASEFLSAKTLKTVRTESLRSQIDYINKYNTDVVDKYNSDPANDTVLNREFPHERAQYPLIIGPLDKVEPNVYYASATRDYRETRVRWMVMAAAEMLLRTPGNPHREQMLKYSFNPPGGPEVWETSILDIETYDKNESLVNFFFKPNYYMEFQRDNLWRDAFTIVCEKYGGVVYEDKHLSGAKWAERPRFQCGYKTASACNAQGIDYLQNKGRTGGAYTEWFDFESIDDTLLELGQSTSEISACGLGKSYMSCAIGNRFGQKTHACIATNSYVPSICSTFKGTYDSKTHTCGYTKQYCQSVGMCYDRVNKVCQLPKDSMFACNSILGGDGGARDWIVRNGCDFDPADISPLMTRTTEGRTMTDLFANKEGINEGMRSTFTDPINIISIIQEVGVELISRAGGSLVTNLGFMFVTTAVIALIIGIQYNTGIQEMNQQPPDPKEYPLEYAMTGVTRDGTAPKSCSYAGGWITKPLSVSWIPQIGIRSMPTATVIPFFKRILMAGVPGSQATAYVGIDTMLDAYVFDKHQTKNYCYEIGKLRAGSNGRMNNAYCIDYQPPLTFVDPNIGELANDSVQLLDGQNSSEESYIVNRAWTDGKSWDTPQYPTVDGRHGAAWGDRPELWKYQLVYDRNKMTMDSTGKYPLKLWDTDYLSQYFHEVTIQAMRIYYCTISFTGKKDDKGVTISGTADLSGASVDDRCWGFLPFKIQNYNVLRMTIPAIKY